MKIFFSISLLSSIGLYSTVCVIPFQAMDVQDKTFNTLVVGGLHTRPKDMKDHWKLSEENCCVMNTDPTAKPDIQADGFDISTFNNRLGNLKELAEVRFERVGDGFDIMKSRPAFKELKGHLKTGGAFVYSSSWLYLNSVDTSRTLAKTFGIQLSSIYHKVIYAGAEDLHAQEDILYKKKPQAPKKLPNIRDYCNTQLPQIFFEEIKNLYASKAYEGAESLKTGMIIKLYENHLDMMSLEGFDQDTLPYEKIKLYTEKLKIWQGIRRVREDITAKKEEASRITTKTIVERHGLDETMDEHFKNSTTSFVVDVEGVHKDYILPVSSLPAYRKMFKEDLGLENIQVLIDKVMVTSNTPFYSLTIQGTVK